MANMQIRQCEKCGKIFENLSINICDKCGSDIPILFKKIEMDGKNINNGLWYKQCPACGMWHKLQNRNDVTRWCENCGETAINNLGEDRVFSYVQYWQMTEPDAVSDVLDKKKSNEYFEISNRNDLSKTVKKVIKYVELKNQNDGKVIKINPGRYVLGAFGDIESEYFYPLKYVSGKHLLIYVEEEHVYIMDNNSKNRTQINGEVISKEDGKMEITSEDKVTIADQMFEVVICK